MIEPGQLLEALGARHGTAGARIVRAPGRVNLIGEHTDYNEGFVLPAAIDLEIRIALVPTDDRRVELERLETGERDGFDLDAIGPKRGAWIDYVAGTASVLVEAGLPVRGFRGVLASTLPISSGLSSSAALELASAWALLPPGAVADEAVPESGGGGPDDAGVDIVATVRASGGTVDRMRLARLAQRAENAYVGVRSGLMDQFASSLGRAGAAMLLDCRSLEHRPVPLGLDRHALVVCDSGSPRRLERSQYNARREQCEAAVAAIAAAEPDVRSLRDVDLAMLERHADRLDPAVARRAEHVVRENARVGEAVDAFERGDLATVGRLFAASHASLRDLYEVSSPELDALVEIATGVPGTAAARMTGAGFGGCTVNLVERSALDRFGETVLRDYPRRTGIEPQVLVVEPADGAGVVE